MRCRPPLQSLRWARAYGRDIRPFMSRRRPRRPHGRTRRTPLRRLLTRLVWPEAAAFADAGSVLCHEWFMTPSGSDRVAARLAGLAEVDVVYTFALRADVVDAIGVGPPLVTWRFGRRFHDTRWFPLLLLVMPVVWRCLDLGSCSRLITSSHSCVNAVRAPAAHRVCYCHTPMRYAWAWRLERERLPGAIRWAIPGGAALLRFFDRRWSTRVDRYVANSVFVARRIDQSYGAPATVVHPPIDVEGWRSDPPVGLDERSDSPFVAPGRLVAYKRIDVAVQAANFSRSRLLVAGDGPERGRLERLAGPSVSFRSDLSDDEMRALVRGARAVVLPGVEDFGMLHVEAQAAGTPVVARGEGGACESVVDGVTGVLVDSDDPAAWAEIMSGFDAARFDPGALLANASSYSSERFDAQMRCIFAEGGWQ